MTIVDTDEKVMVRVNELYAGAAFGHNGSTYIRLRYSAIPSVTEVPAIMLSTGEYLTFHMDTLVTPLPNARVIKW